MIRITNDFHDNERRESDYVQREDGRVAEGRGRGRGLDGGAGRPLAEHTCLRRDPDGRRPGRQRRRPLGHVHEVPNLGIIGGSVFPSSAGRNPTQTIQATAWRTAEHVVRTFK